MSIYLEEYKFFVPNSEKKLLDIEVRHIFYRSLYMELHLMDGGNYRLFYNFAIRPNDLVRIMENFVRENSDYSKSSFGDILASEDFIKVIRKFQPVVEKIIGQEDVDKLIRLLEQFPLKQSAKKYKSDSDCTYISNIYTENDGSKYICWRDIPDEWSALRDIIVILLNYVEDNRGKYSPK
ncbi:MAG: hypothetical protein MR593_05875 [Intestinibacter sp.]|uniref:hypothetical protein n=1 Tax=Intestinibacter sp. TaxID=1965304 RepID=UPI0025C275EC|nr:hypothetical protein [Intestinibacter sp.]MCI6737627.1 hypothetical protein [Intestinibacter sp.]